MKDINTSEFEQEVVKGGKVALDFYFTANGTIAAIAIAKELD